MSQSPQQASDQEVLSIHGMEPRREGECALCYAVGFDDVTKIVKVNSYHGTYCIDQYEVYKGEKRVALVNAHALEQVVFA